VLPGPAPEKVSMQEKADDEMAREMARHVVME
jgi:hypothetical protein